MDSGADTSLLISRNHSGFGRSRSIALGAIGCTGRGPSGPTAGRPCGPKVRGAFPPKETAPMPIGARAFQPSASPKPNDFLEIGGGLPHSDIHGSKLIRSSPWLFAAYHVLHRLCVPRHPPNALNLLDLSHRPCPFRPTGPREKT